MAIERVADQQTLEAHVNKFLQAIGFKFPAPYILEHINYKHVPNTLINSTIRDRNLALLIKPPSELDSVNCLYGSPISRQGTFNAENPRDSNEDNIFGDLVRCSNINMEPGGRYTLTTFTLVTPGPHSSYPTSSKVERSGLSRLAPTELESGMTIDERIAYWMRLERFRLQNHPGTA